jgi:hypothetical protein
VVNSGNFGGSAPGPTVTQAITVGAEADMLVVMTSAELGNLSGDPMTVTYGGVAMNLAVGNRINSGIWYLDLSTPGITGTDVVVDMSGYASRNGFAAGWLSINGNLAADKAIALHGTGTSAAQSNTVDLTATVQTFDVVNFNGNNTSGTITVNSPNPTVIYTDNNIGSARSAAAYVAEVEPGTRTYRWTISGLTPPHADYRRIDAAAFAVVPAGGGNNYADWIANYPGVGGQTGINDDPDGDGVGNGVENFFGTDPGAFSPGLIAGTANDLTAAYRWSTDLTTFHGNGETDTAGTRVDFSTRANTPEPGLTTVAASVAGTSPARLFLTVETTSASVP